MMFNTSTKGIFVFTLILSTSSLVGCETTNAFVAGSPSRVEIDPALLEECPPLPTDSKISVAEDILPVKIMEARMYADCRDGKKRLINVTKKLANIGDAPK